eukprot:590837-Rhodomonas_salina.1
MMRTRKRKMRKSNCKRRKRKQNRRKKMNRRRDRKREEEEEEGPGGGGPDRLRMSRGGLRTWLARCPRCPTVSSIHYTKPPSQNKRRHAILSSHTHSLDRQLMTKAPSTLATPDDRGKSVCEQRRGEELDLEVIFLVASIMRSTCPDHAPSDRQRARSPHSVRGNSFELGRLMEDDLGRVQRAGEAVEKLLAQRRVRQPCAPPNTHQTGSAPPTPFSAAARTRTHPSKAARKKSGWQHNQDDITDDCGIKKGSWLTATPADSRINMAAEWRGAHGREGLDLRWRVA